MPRVTRYEQGFRAGVEAAAKWCETANISPPEAKGHIGNAAGMLRYALERGDIESPAAFHREARDA